jgi:ribosome-associated protein
MNKDDNLLINNIIKGMQERKAKRIALVDMTGLEAPCQYFVICEGTSSTHIEAIADEVRDYVRKNSNQKPFATDGYDNAEWVAMDYGEAIVHIFRSETREFYDIEHLWHDAEIQWIEDID